MLLKRHIPLMIVIGVGLLTLFGHFINNATIQNFVDNDAQKNDLFACKKSAD